MKRSNRLPNLALISIGLIILSLVGIENFFVVMILVFCLFLLARQFNSKSVIVPWLQNEETDYGDDYKTLPRPAYTEQVYSQALRAVVRAGHDPDKIAVLPVDIGFLTLTGEIQSIYRQEYLPDDVDYIQPFIQLRLPIAASGRVRFEIVDGSGKVVFIHEDNHHLERGRTLISPSARLPIHDQREMSGNWQLLVSADNMLLAVHNFQFIEAVGHKTRAPIGEDGELTQELRIAIETNKLPQMSLDELLAHQEGRNAHR